MTLGVPKQKKPILFGDPLDFSFIPYSSKAFSAFRERLELDSPREGKWGFGGTFNPLLHLRLTPSFEQM
jgi:hypothetical protein